MQQPLVLSPLFFAFVIVSRIPLAASFDTNFVNSQTGCLHHRVKVILAIEIITFWLLFVWNNKLAKWINKKKEDIKKNHVLILYMAFFVVALLQCTVKFNIQTEIFILVYRSSANGKKELQVTFFWYYESHHKYPTIPLILPAFSSATCRTFFSPFLLNSFLCFPSTYFLLSSFLRCSQNGKRTSLCFFEIGFS